MEVAVELRGIHKYFASSDVVANREVDFSVRKGEVHALVGENGAGKTTLMNILYGLIPADRGQILIDGREVHIAHPDDAIRLGIGMVHQHFKLVPSFTVAENIMLGMEPNTAGVLRKAEEIESVTRLAESFGLPVDPRARIRELPVGMQQRVEILKTLQREAQILVLDEPTAVLTPQEAEELFGTLRAMREKGHSIVFISHKLDEVMAISDRITVLRGGKNVGTVATAETSPQALSNLMVGREIKFKTYPRPERKGANVLELEGVSALNDRGLPALREVSFAVASGEILGFAGVAGNGQEELAQVITGLRPVTGGSITVRGTPMAGARAKDFIDAGVSYVPADRHGVATVGDMSLTHNSVLRRYRETDFGRGPLLNLVAASKYADQLIAEFDIKTPGRETAVRTLSGGNLQKVILAREMTTRHRLLVVMSATHGLDVGATEFVRETLNRHRHEGAAIVLISEDLEELLSLSDRIAVLHQGEIMGIVDAARAEVESLGLMMAGERRTEAVA